MTKEEGLIKILREMDKKRVEELEPNSRKLFNAIMDIANERDRLLEEKQELIINNKRLSRVSEDRYDKILELEKELQAIKVSEEEWLERDDK